MDIQKVRQHLLRKQHLHPQNQSSDIVQVAGDIVGLHATVTETPYLSLHQRSKAFEKVDLDIEMYEHHTLGKIRSIRKTLFIYPKEFIPFAHKSTAHINQRMTTQYMIRKGIDLVTCEQISKDILEICTNDERTALQIREELGIDLDVYAILNVMCDRGLLIRGRPWRSWQDKTQGYRRFKDLFPDLNLTALEEGKAVGQLVEQYVRAYGPVKETDLIWWTGLPKKAVINAFQNLKDIFVQIPSPDSSHPNWILEEDFERVSKESMNGEDTLNLLPILDPFLMGYRDRRRFLAEAHHEYVIDRSGNITSVILENGEVVGVWDREGGKLPAIKLLLFRSISKEQSKKLTSLAQDLGAFIFDQPVSVVMCKEMIPLTKRTAGSFMRPLKDCSH